MEKEDYSKIYEYEFSGKEYAGEKACISLTSWKARINTVSKTLYSLLKTCPGFHIVLVLSKDEFPNKEKDLPDDLMLFVDNKLIELFWIKPNLKSFKKVLFTMDKYRDIPVISADDDCIYTCNYAQELYDEWTRNKNACVSFTCGYRKNHVRVLWGYSQLFPIGFSKLINLELLQFLIYKNCLDDDDFYTAIREKNKIPAISFEKPIHTIAIQIKNTQSCSLGKERIRHTSDMPIYNKIFNLNL